MSNNSSSTKLTVVQSVPANHKIGRVRVVNKTQNYAYIRPKDGDKEVSVSLTEVQQSGILKGFRAGVYVSYRQFTDSNGRVRATDLSLAPSQSSGKPRRNQFGRENTKNFSKLRLVTSDKWILGTISWFNEKKGYGFVEFPNAKDAFLHNTIFEQCGITIEPGKKIDGLNVKVTLCPGREKGTFSVGKIVLL